MNSGISVIIPVYNAEDFVKNCLKSLTNQTFKDLEILCIIDKNSIDSSENICKTFQKNDNRIKIIKNDNGEGAGFNRNIGIENATNEYMGFIDADDYIDLDFYQRLYDFAQIYDADVAMTETTIFSIANNKTICERRYPFLIEYSLGKKMSLLQEGVCWDKIYRTKLLKENKTLRFPEGVLHEDNLFILKVMDKCNKLLTVPGSFYHWIRNPQSLCFRPDYKEKRIDDAFFIMKEVLDYTNKRCIKPADKKIIFDFMLSHFGTLALNHVRYNDKLAQLLNDSIKQQA